MTASPLGPLGPLTTGDLAAWEGLAPATTLDDLAATGDLDPTWRAPGFLGEARRPMEWLNLTLRGWDRPVRVWVEPEIDRPVLLDSEYPALPGGPEPLLAALGEPDLVLDAYLGTLLIPRSEKVYLGRGLTLHVNPETDVALRVALFAPADAATYRRDLRLDLQKHRLPPRS